MWMANHIEHTEVVERSHPFCGQMGKVFFFSEAITATDVQTLHALGPNFLPKKKSEYLRAFCSVANHTGLLTVLWLTNPSFISTSIEIGHKGNVFSIGNKRYVKIFFAYDPKVTSTHATNASPPRAVCVVVQ